ncbi:MAG: Lrp/AsnC family transcriptional regulator [Candidatus Heimdallarchaeaceae archaeon]
MERISNQQLILALRENGRKPFVRLAEEFGVTEAAIRKRVKQLLEKGIITRFTLDINPEKAGFVVALIGVDTVPQYYLTVLKSLEAYAEVNRLYSSHGDHDIMIEGWFADNDELHKFIEKIGKLKGVTQICPAILLNAIK